MQRYIVESSHRKTNGDWCGVLGETDIPVWYFIRDTDEDAEDWDDSTIAGTPYCDECLATCKLMNHLNNMARATEG